jgi:hypothetical protein
MKFLGKMFGGGDEPKVSPDAGNETDAEKRKLKQSRSALLGTLGGVVGDELNPGEVKRRTTLLGN